MILAIASGKGGTGKTTLSILIAKALDEELQILDCDVEEPNVHIFIDSELTKCEDVFIPVPVIDNDKCNKCGKCQEVCEFNAISVLKNKVLIFDELCHGCGGCMRACPQGAIKEQENILGVVESCEMDNIRLIQGKINVGKPMSPPIIRAVKKYIDDDILNIIDCPPGTSCPVVTSINGADYVLLVTEATPFGLHDLKLSVETLRKMELPFAVIINRADTGDDSVVDYCRQEGIDVPLKIPESMAFANAYSTGGDILNAIPTLKDEIRTMITHIRRGTR